MALWGTIVNALAIIAGALLGSLLTGIPEGMRRTVMQGLGLAILVLGGSMALKSEHFLLVIASLVIGGVIGEKVGLEARLNGAGAWLQRVAGRRLKGDIAAGFVTATLVYCIGAMAILGALESGMKHQHDILYMKAMLDGFSAIIFASTLGIGVLFSAVPILLYEGTIALAASAISTLLGQSQLNAVIAEVTAVGGILIIGIGLNLLEIKKISVANLLPSVLVAAAAVPLMQAAEIWYHQLMNH